MKSVLSSYNKLRSVFTCALISIWNYTLNWAAYGYICEFIIAWIWLVGSISLVTHSNTAVFWHFILLYMPTYVLDLSSCKRLYSIKLFDIRYLTMLVWPSYWWLFLNNAVHKHVYMLIILGWMGKLWQLSCQKLMILSHTFQEKIAYNIFFLH